MSNIKMSEVFSEVFADEVNPSFEVQDCDFYAYRAAHSTSSYQDEAIKGAVLSYDSHVEQIKQLEADKAMLREALAIIANWGELSLKRRADIGSSGVRDYYRDAAIKALAATETSHDDWNTRAQQSEWAGVEAMKSAGIDFVPVPVSSKFTKEVLLMMMQDSFDDLGKEELTKDELIAERMKYATQRAGRLEEGLISFANTIDSLVKSGHISPHPQVDLAAVTDGMRSLAVAKTPNKGEVMTYKDFIKSELERASQNEWFDKYGNNAVATSNRGFIAEVRKQATGFNSDIIGLVNLKGLAIQIIAVVALVSLPVTYLPFLILRTVFARKRAKKEMMANYDQS